MSNPEHIDITRPHAQLSPQSPSGFSGISKDNDTSGAVVFSPKTKQQQQHVSLTENREVDRHERNQALQMLRDRGVDAAERFLDSTSPATVIRTCQWNDRQKNAGAPLLVWKLKQGGVAEEDRPVNKVARLQEIFDRYLEQHPEGSRLCSHAALAARKWPDDREDCAGQMIVVAAMYPVMEIECDQCGFDAALTPRMMKGQA